MPRDQGSIVSSQRATTATGAERNLLEEKHDLAARRGRAGAKGERATSLPTAGAERTLAEDESDRREGGHSTAGKTSGTWNPETETSQAQSPWTPGAFREHSEGFTSTESLHEDEEDSITMLGLHAAQDLGKGNDNTPTSVGDGVLLHAQIVYEYQTIEAIPWNDDKTADLPNVRKTHPSMKRRIMSVLLLLVVVVVIIASTVAVVNNRGVNLPVMIPAEPVGTSAQSTFPWYQLREALGGASGEQTWIFVSSLSRWKNDGRRGSVQRRTWS